MLRTGVAIALFVTWAGASNVARAEPVAPPTDAPRSEESVGTFPPVDVAPARTEEVAACVKAAEGAQSERSAHRLRAARERLLACAQSSCPMVVRNDCATWLAEVDQGMPSVVIQARDTRGIELVDVRVLVDGQLLTSHLDGLAVNVDPGTHVFQFETAGAPALQQQLLIREGEKGRALPVTLSAPPPPPAPPKPERRAPTLTYIFGGLGIAGMAGFTYFGLKGVADAAELRDTCGQQKLCTEEQVAPVRHTLIAADISLGVGLVSLGAAFYFYMSEKPKSSPTAVKPGVALGPGLARFSLEAPF